MENYPHAADFIKKMDRMEFLNKSILEMTYVENGKYVVNFEYMGTYNKLHEELSSLIVEVKPIIERMHITLKASENRHK